MLHIHNQPEKNSVIYFFLNLCFLCTNFQKKILYFLTIIIIITIQQYLNYAINSNFLTSIFISYIWYYINFICTCFYFLNCSQKFLFGCCFTSWNFLRLAGMVCGGIKHCIEIFSFSLSNFNCKIMYASLQYYIYVQQMCFIVTNVFI